MPNQWKKTAAVTAHPFGGYAVVIVEEPYVFWPMEAKSTEVLYVSYAAAINEALDTGYQVAIDPALYS